MPRSLSGSKNQSCHQSSYGYKGFLARVCSLQPFYTFLTGCLGKTFLSSTIIDQALTRSRTLFAFLIYNFSCSTTALSTIHSLIFQLASDDEDLQAILCQSIAKDLKRDLKRTMELLATLLSTAGPTFIVIDGFDEIDEIERARLLQCLLDLSDSCDEAKILVSSRIEDDIHAILCDKAVQIRIDTQNAGSIQAFVSRRVQDWFQSRDFIAEARTEIMELMAPLSSKANGMCPVFGQYLIVSFMDEC